MTKKYIIGLGCSWTQGEGGYPDQVWKDHGGRVQVRGRDDYYLRHIEHENSWVNVLCRDYFPEYTPINLGARGIGNRAAINQLHFCDKVDFNDSEGIIVLMLSGFERYDFFHQNPKHNNGQDDGYSDGEFVHYKWRTAWPFPGDDPIWNTYGKELWSEQFVASSQMIALLDLQTFCKAHNYKLVVANGFNQSHHGVETYLKEHSGYLKDKFNWDEHYIHQTTEYGAMIQKLIWLDGLIKPEDWGAYHNFYHKRDYPAKYLTNCEGAHPTLEGYKVIGEELAKFIKLRGYV